MDNEAPATSAAIALYVDYAARHHFAEPDAATATGYVHVPHPVYELTPNASGAYALAPLRRVALRRDIVVDGEACTEVDVYSRYGVHLYGYTTVKPMTWPQETDLYDVAIALP